MRLCEIFSFKNSFVGSLIFVVLISNCLHFGLIYENLPSAGFLISTSKEENILENFTSIQDAIDKAENGFTIYVPPGIYYEHVIINKTISLIGKNVSTTFIDGGNTGSVVTIIADNVSISGFTIQNSGWGWYRNGIYVYKAENCEIKNNILFQNCHNIRVNCSRNSRVLENKINGTGYGIRLINSANCTAVGNCVSDCIGGVHLENATNCAVRGNYFTQNNQGIRLYSPCTSNTIVENTVYNNVYDGMIEPMPGDTTLFGNVFFHNNFINNTNPFIYRVSGNIWDNGYPSGGNYWSRYSGTDLHSGPYQNETGSDGIGDTQYSVNPFDKDKYPLMHPYGLAKNLETNMTYPTIQSAIDAPETQNGHTIFVRNGVYYEHVVINKNLSLIGENQTTIIDGGGVGTVLKVNANNATVVGFTIRNSGLSHPPYGMDFGVFLDHSIGSNISQCLVTNNRIGIYLFYSDANIIEHNIVSSNHENGIWLWYSGNNVFAENQMLNNSYNFGVFGGDFSDFNNNIGIDNTVDGKPIQYLVSVEDEVFDDKASVGVLYLINCHNVTVRNLNLMKNGHGVFCYNVTDSRIENVTAQDNNYGIYLQYARNNSVTNNRCFNNWVGIGLQDSNYNVVENSVVADCEKGISLYDADNNSLIGNAIRSNLYGIRFYSSHFNKIFYNNITGNTEQVDLINSYQNIWDNGYPFGGNYWSDYNGTDLFSGLYQNVTGSDGIGDTPHVIGANDLDRYPQVQPRASRGEFDWWLLTIILIVVAGTVTATALIFRTRRHSTHENTQISHILTNSFLANCIVFC